MHKLVSSEEMRRLEQEAAELGLPGPALMENAGRAVADLIRQRFPATSYRRVLVVAGPGNNGGDGLVSARHLHDFGYDVVVYFANRPLADDAKVRLLRQRAVPIYQLVEDPNMALYREILDSSDLVLDAVFGTGRLRPLTGAVATILDEVRAAVGERVVVALDIPSGVNADSGVADPHAAAAVLTITLGEPKRGLVLRQAVDLVGELAVADIGIPAELSQMIPAAFADAPAVAPRLPTRPRASNKGSFGRVLIVAGSALYTGAPVLAALGAERSGAGLVTIACPRTVQPAIASHTLESTFLPLPDEGAGSLGPAASETLLASIETYRAILIGPGIGRSEATEAFLQDFVPKLPGRGVHLILDADALTLISKWNRWWEQLPPETILTPHPGEMARLTGPTDVDDRLVLAQTSAIHWKVNLILKGAYSVLASPSGEVAVLPFANPALATAGTGDVLAGAILGLLGQGLAPFDAVVAGGFLHGTAGEIVRHQIGPAGVLAGDVARALPDARRAVCKALYKPLP